MIYFAGDNAFDDLNDRCIEQLKIIGSNNSVHLVAFQDNSRKPAEILYFKKDSIDILKSYSKIDSADPNTIVDFVKFCHDKFPANKYLLVISGRRGIHFTDPISGKEYECRNTLVMDDSIGSHYSIIEFADAMKQINKIIGDKLDILGIDVDLMQRIENCYEIKDYVKFIVAPENTQPAYGWPYENINKTLCADPNIEAKDLSSLIVKNHNVTHETDSLSISAIDCSKIEAVSKKLDDICEEIILKNSKSMDNKINCKNFYIIERLYTNHTCDLIVFLLLLKKHISVSKDVKLVNMIDELIAMIHEKPDKLVINVLTKNTKKINGISIYLPRYIIPNKYNDLKFYKTKWPNFLKEFLDYK